MEKVTKCHVWNGADGLKTKFSGAVWQQNVSASEMEARRKQSCKQKQQYYKGQPAHQANIQSIR